MWPVMLKDQIVGALDFENISEFLMIQSAIEKFNDK